MEGHTALLLIWPHFYVVTCTTAALLTFESHNKTEFYNQVVELL